MQAKQVGRATYGGGSSYQSHASVAAPAAAAAAGDKKRSSSSTSSGRLAPAWRVRQKLTWRALLALASAVPMWHGGPSFTTR